MVINHNTMTYVQPQQEGGGWRQGGGSTVEGGG